MLLLLICSFVGDQGYVALREATCLVCRGSWYHQSPAIKGAWPGQTCAQDCGEQLACQRRERLLRNSRPSGQNLGSRILPSLSCYVFEQHLEPCRASVSFLILNQCFDPGGSVALPTLSHQLSPESLSVGFSIFNSRQEASSLFHSFRSSLWLCSVALSF